MYLNIMLPEFIIEYAISAYVIISVIEGALLNLALYDKWHKLSGFVIGALMNFVSSAAGLLIIINFSHPHDAFEGFSTACFLSIVIEYAFVSLIIKEAKVRRLFFFLTIGNIITYILLAATSPLMTESAWK